MPKASSPIRLQQELMQAAETAASYSHRSTAEQVEYWAFLGRKVANHMSPETILAISSGLAELKIENIDSPSINPDKVFSALEEQRQSGSLTDSVSEVPARYQASASHPGQLEQVDADGNITVGQFNNGVFTPKTST